MPNGSNATFDLDIVYVLPRHDNALLVRVELNNKHSDFRLKYLFFFEKTIINCVVKKIVGWISIGFYSKSSFGW